MQEENRRLRTVHDSINTTISNDDGSLRECDCDDSHRGDTCDIARVCVNNGPCVSGTCVEGEAAGAYRCDNCDAGYIGENCSICEYNKSAVA